MLLKKHLAVPSFVSNYTSLIKHRACWYESGFSLDSLLKPLSTSSMRNWQTGKTGTSQSVVSRMFDSWASTTFSKINTTKAALLRPWMDILAGLFSLTRYQHVMLLLLFLLLITIFCFEPPEWNPGHSPLKKLLTFRYPTLRRSTDSLSRRDRTSSVKGSRLVSLSSSPLSRSLWRLEGLDLMPSGGGGLGLTGDKSKIKIQK